VQLVFENLTATSLSNTDIEVELLSFPSASYSSGWTNYVTGTQGTYVYPADTIIERRTIWQFNKALSGENAAPGQFGRATLDFRFDPPLAVTTTKHYGIRIINRGATAPATTAYGVWAESPQLNGFPSVNGTIRNIGVKDIDNTNAPTITMPLALTANSILSGSASLLGGMVIGNSLAGVGMPTVRRTENEHWMATYSTANSNWTIVGTASGTQARKLVTTNDGSTGISWVDDGATLTTLSLDSTATNVICVNSVAGFATNQYIDIWDSDTATIQRTIASTTESHASCSNGPAITTTSAITTGYTLSKNAAVARAVWKQRIIQGAIQTLSADTTSSAVVCVPDSSKFAIGGTVAIYDNNSPIITRTISSFAGSCGSGQPMTLNSSPGNGTYTVAQNATIAEVSATLSNSTLPSNGAIMRWTSFNHAQNPTDSSLLARTTSITLAYAKSQSPATSATNYPYLSNRHIFFVAYGDADTTAPVDGDIIIVGNGKSDPDSADSPNLLNDLNWASKESHIVTIDRSWDAAMAYSGTYGAAVGDGAGSRIDFAAWSPNGGWISALVTPGSQLGIDNSPNKHYRITIPGKIVVDSDASVALGNTSSAIPSSSGHDIFFDTTSPAVSSNLTVDSAASVTLTVASTAGFMPGDTIVLDDNNSVPITRIIAAVQNSTTLTLTAAAVTGYTTAQGAFVAKGPSTELPTGTDRRAGIYTMTGFNAASTPAQSNIRAGRIKLFAKGSEDFRTAKSNLAVDIDGNVDTGYLGNNMTDAGNTWLDVTDDVTGDWQPLDKISVGGGTNLLADNMFSSPGLGRTDDANQFPLWTGAATKTDAGAGGRNDLPTPNTETAEIGTIPMTDIYNSNYNGGSVLFSSNYNNSTSWTIFNDGANTEINDAVYFGDQGNNMLYALEFNLGQTMSASIDYVWEYYKSGVGWTQFNPRDAYQYIPRSDVTLPLSVDTVNNSLTITLAEGGTVFGLDQIVMIDDNDSEPIFRRLATSAPTATLLTFSEPVPSGYTVAQGATVKRLNGGNWKSINPESIFSNGLGRKILAWTPSDLNGTPAKTTVNGVSAYWVRARISSFTSWTNSPSNQITPVGMGGVEKLPSSIFNISSGVQEAKISAITPGSSFNPNETYILEYGNSPGWTQILPIVPVAPYTWHISNGILSQNTATTDFHVSNGDFSWGDYTVTAKVKMRTTADATSRKIGIVLRDSLDGNGYGALIEKTTTNQRIGIYPMALGADGTVFANTTKTFTANDWYWIKTNVTGIGASTVISAKFWADGSSEPGSWDVTYTTNAAQGIWNTGSIGLFADAMIADFDDVTVDNGSVVLADAFTHSGTWKLRGSINGDLGTITPGTPFSSNYLNLTLKHKGGWNGTVLPEIGDKIYISSTSTRSYKGLSGTGEAAITTSNANTVYENIDFEWNPQNSNYTVSGSATGSMGTATPGSKYTATGGKISLTIPSGSPTATKFGERMLLLQDNFRVNNGSWIGNNGQGSAVLIAPTYTLTSSAITPRYNIEGQSGTNTARQNGTIDFWFKTNYDGSPSYLTHPKGMYLFDQANQSNTDRLFIRHSPDGYLEAAVFAGAAQGVLLRQSFSATAGQWYHFRLAWNETLNAKRAWLDGVAFSAGQASVVGTRGANAGLIRIGNTWTYDAPFDGAIDELAIFDDGIDTSSSCNWGDFTIPTTIWTNGVVAGCDDADSDLGTNTFRASFDRAMNPQEGFVWADYAFGNPAMIFTNGADTGNERIRVVTYPERTRVWIDNTGEKYTPSARIKFGSGYQESAALATLAGWSHNYTFHHKAARQSESSPTYSPVLNLRRSTHIWSEEPITQTGAAMGAPINAGMGYGMGTIGLSGLGEINFADVSMENQYTNFAILTNPFTSLTSKPSQTIANSVFYNFYDRAYTVAGKTEGSNYVGAYFVTTHYAAANIGSGYNCGTSQNVGIDGSIFMGNRNAYVTVPPAAANGAASFYSGRLYSVKNSEFYNNGVAGAGVSGALNFGTGVAKVDITDNIFSINTQGIRLYGNAFINMENNIFEGHVSDNVVTNGADYGSGVRAAQSYSSVAVTDKNSIFGRGLWNEADIGLPPNTGTFESESLLQFTGEGTRFFSPLLFGTVDYSNMNRIADGYIVKTIPGTDIRVTYSDNKKDIVNFTTSGLMRTTGPGLNDTLARTAGGYAWRLEPTDPDVPLDYTVKLVGVAGKPLAVTGYIRLNSNYNSTNLPTVTLSGLGMIGANLTWTAQSINDQWQQFVVSGTPTESALAELKISGKLSHIVSDSGTSELISNATGNYLPALLEDNDKSWTPNQWVGYKMRDQNGKVFEIVKNTDRILYLKGMVLPHLLSTTFAALTPGDYVIYNEPYFYLDDVSVLSGSVDTGTLDFHSGGQPVSPWLSTGLTAEGVWNAQFSSFANSQGSFGQLLGDSLVANYADVFDPSPTTTEFDSNLTISTDDFYNNGIIIFTEGTNKGVVRRISDYVGLNKTIIVDPALPSVPADGDRFAVLAGTSSSSGGTSGGASAADIWSYAFRQLTTETLANGGSLATAADIATIRADIASVLTELGTGNIAAIKTKTDTISWSDVTGLVTTAGQIKAKTDTISWSDVTGIVTTAGQIKDKTDTINWSDVTGIKTKTDTISWSDVTGIVTTAGQIKDKTDTINWSDVTGIKTSTDTIDWSDIASIKTSTDTISWSDVTGIKTKTDTITWGDITDIKSSVANLISEIGVGNISAIKTSADSINWSDITGIVTNTGLIKAKTDTIDWANVSAIKTSTDTISWSDVTGIKTKTDTIAWGDITGIQSSVNSLNNISAADIWTYANRTITGEVALTAESRKAIWESACAILNTSGSVGKLVCDNLDAAISSRSTLTASQVWAEATRTITGLDNPALAAIANNVWDNASRTLTNYGNDITAQNVWDVLTSSLTTIDSIGKLLVTNVDETISSRSTESSLNTLSQNVATTSALVDQSISSRASQASLDAHEAAQASFRTQTASTLGAMSINVGEILSQLSTIETKIDTIHSTLNTINNTIDTIGTDLGNIKTKVDDTHTKVTAMQTVSNDILAKWGSYDATNIIGYIDALETHLGDPADSTASSTVFGKLNYIKENGGGSNTVDGVSDNLAINLIYTQTQSIQSKLLEVQTELGLNGKSTTAYEEMMAIKNYVDTVESSLSTLDSRTSSIVSSMTNVSSDLKTMTEGIGKVSTESLTQLFEIKKTDIDYLTNKIIELKAMADINRQLLEKTANQPIVKVVMEWGSVVIKFVIVNPSETTQKIPFKAFLPKEVKQEYIIDLGGLTLNYDTSTEQYYVTSDITLEKGESVIRNVRIKDIWIISEDEVASLRKQAEELSNGLKDTSYNAQALTLKTDINTRLDKVERKQKENNATPQDHILAYRENMEDMKAVQENLKGLKDLVLGSSTSNNFLASIGGIQTFATWGIILALIFSMGVLGSFYYSLWKRKIVTETIASGKKSKKEIQVELPTPNPLKLSAINLSWFRKIILGWMILLKTLLSSLEKTLKKLLRKIDSITTTFQSMPKKPLMTILIIGFTITLFSGLIFFRHSFQSKQKPVQENTSVTILTPTPTPLPSSKEEQVEASIVEIVQNAAEKQRTNAQIEEMMKKTQDEATESATFSATIISEQNAESLQTQKVVQGENEQKILGAVSEHKQLLVIKQTPTGWLNVREKPSSSSEIITKVYPGESYPFSEIKSGWYKILLKDLTEGWVANQYVKPEKQMNDI